VLQILVLTCTFEFDYVQHVCGLDDDRDSDRVDDDRDSDRVDDRVNFFLIDRDTDSGNQQLVAINKWAKRINNLSLVPL
jgi:hypothetical protein